ncbi:MAG: hypothetical protein ACLQBA_26400 [Candidatus Binataceae bacterium]
MRPRVVVYVSADELAQMRREAARRRVSLSRYAKERLTPSPEASGAALNGGGSAAEQRRDDGLQKLILERAEGLGDNLRTLIVMLDQLVLSTLTHLPEIPMAQQAERLAAGARRHASWRQEAARLIEQMRADAAGQPSATNGHGAHA